MQIQIGPELELSSAENSGFDRLASLLRISAAVMLATTGVELTQVLVGLGHGGFNVSTVVDLGVYVIGAVFTGFFGAWTLTAARGFSLISKTAGHDRRNLMDGLDNLRRILRLKYVILCVAIGLFGLGYLALTAGLVVSAR